MAPLTYHLINNPFADNPYAIYEFKQYSIGVRHGVGRLLVAK